MKSEVKECKYCGECIYYEKCSVNSPYHMECKSDCLLCGSPFCCEDFISHKSIDDIYEEQKTTSECRLCKKCLHYGENGCRMTCGEEECKFGLYGVPCCLGFQTTDEEFSKDPMYRECGIYVGDEPLPEPEPNPNFEPLPEPQFSYSDDILTDSNFVF